MATDVCGNNRLVYSLREKHKYAKAQMRSFLILQQAVKTTNCDCEQLMYRKT
jgi:hypothetical protein